jgi:large conductance mechanosensitive channel
MLKEFKAFLMRGNLMEIAVALVLALAFASVVTSLVENLITPLIAAIFGEPDFSRLTFTINDSEFGYGAFINAVISFVLVAAAVFFFVIRPVNALMARVRRGEASPDPTTRQCTECLSDIPIGARRCAFCTSPQTPA